MRIRSGHPLLAPSFATALALALVTGCRPPEYSDSPVDSEPVDDTDYEPPDDTAAPPPAAWNYLVYMDGDNDLESYVTHDLNELEAGDANDAVNILVLADRIEGYADDDGDWTGSRYYRIAHDDDDTVVSSPVAEDLGEVNMANPDVLANFLEWASTNYPADHTALVLWDHGSGWDFAGDAPAEPAPPSIAQDDTSTGVTLSIAEGDVAAALTPWVTEHGRLDMISFDACNMATWEVAYAFAPFARTMTAAETTVGWEGYRYELVLDALAANPAMTATELADAMARTTVEGGEWSHSATDLDKVGDLAARIDTLALALMAQDDGGQWAWELRDSMQSADTEWVWYFTDLNSLAHVIAAAPEGSPEVIAAANDVADALTEALIGNYAIAPYAGLGGLTIFFDPRRPYWTDLYTSGVGATWAQDTHWDDYLLSIDTEAATTLR